MKPRLATLPGLALLAVLCWLTAPRAAQAQLYFPPLLGNTWDTLSPGTDLGWCTARIPALYDFLASQNTKAFIVLKNGKIVLERYFGTFTQDSLWYWASAGKTLTATLVGIAQQEGDLKITDTTSRYLGTGWTACTPAQEERITIWHQLTMTSGLNDNVPDHYCTLDTCLQYLADPGTRWAYHNGPYTLLDGVLEAATGQPLNTYTAAKISNKIGMTGMFVKVGYNNVFLSKARSMARFGLLMLNRGTWNTTPVLTDTAYFRQMTTTSQQLNKSYGYLWWLNGKPSYMLPGVPLVINGPLGTNTPPDAFIAMGKNGQFVNVVPSQNLVMIRMGNAPSSLDVPAFLNDSIWKYLNPVMETCTTSALAPGLAPPAPTLALTPNPASAGQAVSLTLTGQAPGTAYTLRMLDALGRPVLEMPTQPGANTTLLPTHTLPAGVYTVQALASPGLPPVAYTRLLVQ